MLKFYVGLLLVVLTLISTVCFAADARYEQGVINTTNMIKQDPNNIKAYEARCFFYLQLGKPDEAFEDASKAIKMNTTLSLPYWVRGSIYHMYKDDKKSALADFNKGIELENNNPNLYVARAQVKRSLNDDNGALKDLDSAINLDKNFANAYFLRGHVKFKLGDRKGSALDYIKASELEPNNKQYAQYRDVFGKHANGNN